ncbi:MAG: hypothetical protein WBX27_12295 [Specibacter sp.]
MGVGAHLPFWAGLFTGVMAATALVMAVTTPARSGPYCMDGCIRYPYTDVTGFVPRDYLWMSPALLAPVAFVVVAACIQEAAAAKWQHTSLAGLSIATVASGILAVDYGLQLSVVQPSLLAGESSGLSLLSQYNPHGLFVGLENLGYGALALVFVFLGVPLTKASSGRTRLAGWSLAVGGALGLLLLVVLVVLAAVYRNALDVRFEVLAILLSCLVLITACTLLALEFPPKRAHKAHLSALEPTNGGGEV